jgi:hypothetical protein
VNIRNSTNFNGSELKQRRHFVNNLPKEPLAEKLSYLKAGPCAQTSNPVNVALLVAFTLGMYVFWLVFDLNGAISNLMILPDFAPKPDPMVASPRWMQEIARNR